MKLTNQELLNVKEPLAQLIRVKLPVLVGLELIKLAHKLDEFLIPIERVREGLINTYGTVPKESPLGRKSVRPGDENWEKFIVEFGELASQENEVDISPVCLPSTFEIEPSILMALEKFIKIV